ncbi:MAG: hypothetical protein ABIG42_03025 [bacterium]
MSKYKVFDLIKRKYENIFSICLNEAGFTLLEAVIASVLTAGTLVLILFFSMRSFEITNEINSVNDMNHSFRRTQRAFVRDVQMGQYFFCGADLDNENNQIPYEFIDRRILTIGYKNDGGEMIWSRYSVKVSPETGVYYLLNTTNELGGGVNFETNILATDVSDLHFTYYDENDVETIEAKDVRRIEMFLSLAKDEISDKMDYTATLRGENLGIAIPDKNLEVYQDANFVK